MDGKESFSTVTGFEITKDADNYTFHIKSDAPEALILWNMLVTAGYKDLNLTLHSDITMPESVDGLGNWSSVANGYEELHILKRFSGTVEGNNKTITGIHLYSEGTEFSFIATLFGKVQNLHLKDIVIDGEGSSVGGIAGYNEGVVDNCSVSGTIKGYFYVGGLVGSNYGVVINSVNYAQISTASSPTGGIVGANEHTMIACGNHGTITAKGGWGGAAGIAGDATSEALTVGCWTVDNMEFVDKNHLAETKDGVGSGTGTACFNFASAASATQEIIDVMNSAIKAWNSTEGNTLQAREWVLGTDYPVLAAPAE